MKSLVIFDLDGTLLDTLADLADSTNFALTQCGFPTHPTDSYRYFVGNGINKLFERALPVGEKSQENIARMRALFLDYYSKHGTDATAPFPGVQQLLSHLQQQGIKLAVASNKYHEATLKMVTRFFPDIHFELVLGQREGIAPKPDPAIVYEILTHTGVAAADTLYVGDSGVDMQTAINSGVDACGIGWGFRPVSELMQFNPAFLVESPSEILGIVR